MKGAESEMKGLAVAVAAMAAIVAASNYFVQFPINDWLTWGAFTYPVSFLVTDLTNRTYGPARARRVVYVGFGLAVILSIWLATPRIALASGTAFLAAQLADVYIFNRLRRLPWWQAPLISSVLASTLDTALFFSLAFAGLGLPWVTWALGDLGVKFAVAGAMLIPFRVLMRFTVPRAGLAAP
jgi:uncharacterized PurR-regulated membrane protein YhhQ (DUF165 family)